MDFPQYRRGDGTSKPEQSLRFVFEGLYGICRYLLQEQ